MLRLRKWCLYPYPNIVKMRNFLLSTAVLFFGFGLSSFGPSPSKLCKEAKGFQDLKMYPEAIRRYDEALALKSSFTDAYEGRASCFEMLGQWDKAMEDYKMLINIKSREETYRFRLAFVYHKLKRYQTSAEQLSGLIMDGMKTPEAYELMVRNKICLLDYEGAIAYCNEAFAMLEQNPFFYYLRGVAQDSARNYQLSTLSYRKAIDILEANKKKPPTAEDLPYYLNAAESFNRMGLHQDAVRILISAKKISSKDPKLTMLIGNSMLRGGDYNGASKQFDEALILKPENYDAWVQKGLVLRKLKQHFNAIEALDKALVLDSTNWQAHLEKGGCFEDLNEFDQAEACYRKAAQLSSNNPEPIKRIKLCRDRAFEINRESGKPEVVILTPKPDGNSLVVPLSRNFIDIDGQILDKSRISSIEVDGQAATFSKDSLQPRFHVAVSLEGKVQLKFKAVDIYYNTSVVTYSLSRQETTPPKLIFLDPLAMGEKEIYLPKGAGNTLVVKGRVDDESVIHSLSINGISANFSQDVTQPEFQLEIPIKGIDTLKAEVTDAYGNTGIYNYYLNRKALAEAAVNPMGITWVVFIENSDYSNFSSLVGPARDLKNLQEALLGYRVDQFIIKRNLTKDDLERFFALDLRQQLRSAQVNSLLIWYAGHGKFINGNGYWIPVNALKADEFSYFQITNLKGYISTYPFLKHVLVVSDACETGAAFCVESKETVDPGDCLKSDAVSRKSAQVFTSSSTEKSSDVSIFNETFCSILKNSPEKCIPIERIRGHVIKSVTNNQNQVPKFGTIMGLEQDKGSFYFMKK